MTLEEQLSELDKKIERLYQKGANDEKLNDKKRVIQKQLRNAVTK